METTHLSRKALRHGWPRSLFAGFLLLTVPLLGLVHAEDQRPRDPVQEFRDALKVDRGARTAEALAFRNDTLTKAADKVQSLGELAQVLLLQEWIPGIDDNALTLIGDRFEARLKADLTIDKDKSDSTRQAAAAVLVRDTVIKTRSNKGVRPYPLTKRLANASEDLVKLIQSPLTPNAVRADAVSALGEIEPIFFRPMADVPDEKIRPKAKSIEDVLKQQLQADDAQVRAAAGKALADFVQGILLFAEKNSSISGAGEERRRSEARKTAAEAYRVASLALIVDAAASRLNDPHVEVRRACVDVLNTVALITALTLIREPYAAEGFPPPGRAWSPEERNLIEASQREVAALRDQLNPLLKACQEAVPALAKAAVSDKNAEMRLNANHVLEYMALARQRLVRLEDSIPKEKKGAETGAQFEVIQPRLPTVSSSSNVGVPAPSGVTSAVGRPVLFRAADVPDDPLGNSLHKALPTVEKGLSDPDPQVRQATIDALETMGDAAAPALPALVKALDDRSKFVRWSASRVLGKLAPRSAAVVVPKLAELTVAHDLDVRLAAISALERYGPGVKDLSQATRELVIRYLGNSAVNGDGDPRIAAMKVLQSMGVIAAPTLPAVARNLTEYYGRSPHGSGDTEPAYLGVLDPNEENFHVRQAACETLGSVGPLALQAEPDAAKKKALTARLVAVLTKALSDPNPDVRLAASDALLKVTRK